jgi:hypothetical protein
MKGLHEWRQRFRDRREARRKRWIEKQAAKTETGEPSQSGARERTTADGLRVRGR